MIARDYPKNIEMNIRLRVLNKQVVWISPLKSSTCAIFSSSTSSPSDSPEFKLDNKKKSIPHIVWHNP